MRIPYMDAATEDISKQGSGLVQGSTAAAPPAATKVAPAAGPDADQEEPDPAGPPAPPPCEECGAAPSKYRCPACQRRSCSLTCVRAHKEATGCSGQRDRTAFVALQDFDDRALLSDFRLLEEIGRADDVARRCRPPAAKQQLPAHLASLVYQASWRSVKLLIMPPGMAKRKANTTRYDGRNRTMWWRVEWRFPAAGIECADERVDEHAVISEVLSAHLRHPAPHYIPLRPYAKAGPDRLRVFMKKEKTPANQAAYFPMDSSKPLASQLSSRTIIEFPVFIVALPHEAANYPPPPIPTPQPQPKPAPPQQESQDSPTHPQTQDQAQTQAQLMPPQTTGAKPPGAGVVNGLGPSTITAHSQPPQQQQVHQQQQRQPVGGVASPAACPHPAAPLGSPSGPPGHRPAGLPAPGWPQPFHTAGPAAAAPPGCGDPGSWQPGGPPPPPPPRRPQQQQQHPQGPAPPQGAQRAFPQKPQGAQQLPQEQPRPVLHQLPAGRQPGQQSGQGPQGSAGPAGSCGPAAAPEDGRLEDGPLTKRSRVDQPVPETSPVTGLLAAAASPGKAAVPSVAPGGPVVAGGPQAPQGDPLGRAAGQAGGATGGATLPCASHQQQHQACSGQVKREIGGSRLVVPSRVAPHDDNEIDLGDGDDAEGVEGMEGTDLYGGSGGQRGGTGGDAPGGGAGGAGVVGSAAPGGGQGMEASFGQRVGRHSGEVQASGVAIEAALGAGAQGLAGDNDGTSEAARAAAAGGGLGDDNEIVLDED